MPKTMQTLCCAVIGFLCLLLGSGQSICDANSPKPQIKFENQLLTVRSSQVPLQDLLQTVADQLQVSIKSRAALDTVVSCHFKTVTVEDFLRRLLGHTNYVVLYQADKTGTPVPVMVEIMGNQGLVKLSPVTVKNSQTGSVSETPAPQDTLQPIDEAAFEVATDDAALLAKQISSESIYNEKWGGDGIRIKKIAPNSIFDRIGVEEEDIITDVNGTRVLSTEQFIELLTTSQPEMGASIRIERIKADQQMDPIYIDLQ
jgi:hypothetical protein